MWPLGPAWDDEASLAAAWRGAAPFPHLVVDDVFSPETLAEITAVAEDETVERYEGDIFVFEATAPEPRTEALARLRATFADVFAPRVARITGKTLRRVDLRFYAYRAGHFLLPHADHQEGTGRQIAYACYLPSPEPPEGGELELFRCEVRAGEIVATTSAATIAPVPNRLVVFDVSDVSLHQVREVLSGLRVSIAGWFHA